MCFGLSKTKFDSFRLILWFCDENPSLNTRLVPVRIQMSSIMWNGTDFRYRSFQYAWRLPTVNVINFENLYFQTCISYWDRTKFSGWKSTYILSNQKDRTFIVFCENSVNKKHWFSSTWFFLGKSTLKICILPFLFSYLFQIIFFNKNWLQ